MSIQDLLIFLFLIQFTPKIPFLLVDLNNNFDILFYKLLIS